MIFYENNKINQYINTYILISYFMRITQHNEYIINTMHNHISKWDSNLAMFDFEITPNGEGASEQFT